MIVVDSPPGITSPASPSSSSARRTSTTSALPCSQHLHVLAKRPLQSEHPDPRRALHSERATRPRTSSRSSSEACSRRCRPSAGRGRSRHGRRLRSSKWVVASTIARGRRATSSAQPSRSSSGSRPLEDAEPTKTPSAPSSVPSEASAGVSDTARGEGRPTGRRPFSANQRMARTALDAPSRPRGARRRAAPALANRSKDRAHVRQALTMSPVPASPFVRIIATPSEIRRSASPRSVAPQTNGTVYSHLST